VEPSLDACDHYHRFAEDIRLLASLGINTYRISIEWARNEPERGAFSHAALDHYRRMLAACHEAGVTPMVTFYHFSSPRWFAGLGGWEHPAAADMFVRYAERAAHHFGDLIRHATTFNEPNLPMLLKWVADLGISLLTVKFMQSHAASAIGAKRFGCFFLGDAEKLERTMIAAHHRAREAMKSGAYDFPVGVSLAIQDEQADGPKSKRDVKRAQVYDPWLAAANASDFVGIQTYTRQRVGKSKDIPPDPGAELTQMGYEFWPEALEAVLRYTASKVRVPIYITENGLASEDDERRIEYIRRALDGVRRCLVDGIDVRGYIHWSLLDNFEWIFGSRPKFGLITVNRETQERTVKPSGRFLGSIARRNGVLETVGTD
jgi:beta-glucosidase